MYLFHNLVDKIKKSIEKYAEVIDTVPTNDKFTLVHSELQELHAIAAQLDRIEKLLPALNTDNYMKFRQDYKNLHLLHTCSIVKESSLSKVEADKPSDKLLQTAREEHRKNVDEVF